MCCRVFEGSVQSHDWKPRFHTPESLRKCSAMNSPGLGHLLPVAAYPDSDTVLAVSYSQGHLLPVAAYPDCDTVLAVRNSQQAVCYL